MTELYAFAFSLGLGIAARLLYVAASLLAKRTDLIPVTVVLDTAVVTIVGVAFAAFIILSGAVIAPYMFACLAAGYLLALWATKKAKRSLKPRRKKDGAPDDAPQQS